jgi:hypothetical protein
MSYGNSGQFDPGAPQGGQRAYPQSYNDPSFPPPRPPSNNRTLYWILGIVSFITLGGVLLCCGFGFFGLRMASSELAKQFRPQIQNSPEIVEHIGEIQDMSLSIRGMQRAGEAGVMIFDVTGTKGSGQVSVDMARVEDGDGAFELILADGRRIPLTGVEPADDSFDWQEPVEADEPPRTDPPQVEQPPAVDADQPLEADSF